MTTLAYNGQMQAVAMGGAGGNVPFELHGIRELNPDEIACVSGGGGILDSALTGFTVGGAVGGVIGAAVYGTVAGFNTGGAFLASLGFAAGFGWGAGSYLYHHMVSH